MFTQSVHTHLRAGSGPDTMEAHRLRASFIPASSLVCALFHYEKDLSKEAEAAQTEKPEGTLLSKDQRGKQRKVPRTKGRRRLSNREQRADSDTQ